MPSSQTKANWLLGLSLAVNSYSGRMRNNVCDRDTMERYRLDETVGVFRILEILLLQEEIHHFGVRFGTRWAWEKSDEKLHICKRLVKHRLSQPGNDRACVFQSTIMQ